MSDVEIVEEAGDLSESGNANSNSNATNSQAFSLDQHDVELDYEPEDEEDAPKNDLEMEKISDSEKDEDDFDDEKEPDLSLNEKSEKEKTDEELEEGELSDEDEEARKERLKPQPVCRFFSKGLCSWGESCRFVHPGVLDKGNYSMFAPPRPILPRTTPIEKEVVVVETPPGPGAASSVDEDAPRPPRPETAWERGLRQAKEMKKLSQQRKETDSEYEEKRTALSLAQAELEKENDYYARQASPLRDNDSNFGDDFDEFFPDSFQPSTSSSGKRRIAPPPPQDFYPPPKLPFYRHKNRNAPARRYPPSPPRDRFSVSPPPRVRRVAPPRSPREVDDDIREHHVPPHGPPARRRPADAWEDPWMRGGKADKERSPGASKRRSYSSGSSRSSSRSSSTSRSRSRGYRGRSSSISSRSSSRSRSRSSTPKGIPRRGPGTRGRQSPPNRTPPHRQPGRVPPGNKRGQQQGPPQPLMKRIKQEPPDSKPKLLKPKIEKGLQPIDPARKRRSRSTSGSSRSLSNSPPRKRKPSPRPPQSLSNNEPISRPNRPPQEPPVRAPRTPPRKPDPPVQKQVRMTIKSNSVKPTPKSVLEKLGLNAEDEAQESTEKEAVPASAKKKGDEDVEKPGKKSDHGKASKATRREELLKQLKAVENAIAKKRTKYQEIKPSSGKGRAS